MPKDYLVGLHPLLIERITKVLRAMEAIGHPMKIYRGFATAEEQNALYQKGRSLPGPKVTDADGYHMRSNHQDRQGDGLGYAVDCCFTTGDAFGPDQPWALYQLLGKTVGLRPTAFKGDLNHLQLP